jgi:hypothetical protein
VSLRGITMSGPLTHNERLAVVNLRLRGLDSATVRTYLNRARSLVRDFGSLDYDGLARYMLAHAQTGNPITTQQFKSSIATVLSILGCPLTYQQDQALQDMIHGCAAIRTDANKATGAIQPVRGNVGGERLAQFLQMVYEVENMDVWLATMLVYHCTLRPRDVSLVTPQFFFEEDGVLFCRSLRKARKMDKFQNGIYRYHRVSDTFAQMYRKSFIMLPPSTPLLPHFNMAKAREAMKRAAIKFKWSSAGRLKFDGLHTVRHGKAVSASKPA